MRCLEFVFCCLMCLCIAAAAGVALLWSFWLAFIPGAFVIVFGVLVLVTERARRRRENGDEPKA